MKKSATLSVGAEPRKLFKSFVEYLADALTSDSPDPFADLLKREAFELKAPNASHTLIFYLLDIIGDLRIDPDDNSVFNCDSAVRL